MIAYADEVILKVKEKFLNTVCILTEGYLNVVSNWAHRSGSTVNPSKTEIVLFTRRYKISNMSLLPFGGSRLPPIDKGKYLRLMVDRKLSWWLNIEKSVRKASIAVEELYVNGGAICKRWGEVAGEGAQCAFSLMA